MAIFRSGFKIIGELTLKQSLARIRSFSEDRKPGSWLPEDQWAVRPPCTTCPDPCTPKKPKASKSWLSICKDPEPPLTCDIRHNNCPPPKTDDEPWYAFLTKKKPEKPKPPLSACRVELQRQAEMTNEEETCENLGDTGWPEEHPPPCPPCPEEPICKERQPAPVIRLSCPPPKELDLMLWCGRPGLTVARIASQCQSDRMPYEEFRPRKCWKPPPYSLPNKSESPAHQPFCCNVGRAPLAEYKQVEIPKPVYTRYKSVELEDENFLLCMTDARCPPDNTGPSLAIEPPPIKKAKPPPEEPKPEQCIEKPVLAAASRKPYKLKCAPKLTFRPKPTKLTERRHPRNPCAQHQTCNLMNIKPPEEEKPNPPVPICLGEPPKVITSNITDEPAVYQRTIPAKKPPLWMFVVSKPGSNDTPLVPYQSEYPKEPDWSGETDGLKFYDDQNEGISPKPPPDPCQDRPKPSPSPPPCSPKPKQKTATPFDTDEKFVLMPEKYNIRNMRPTENKNKKDLSDATLEEFIETQSANIQKCSKLYPQKKESILYDFARNCPLPPMDPSKPDPPPRKPPEPECPQPTRFYYRRYSTFTPFRNLSHPKFLNRMSSGDSRESCKPRKLIPKPRECGPQVKGPSCNEMTLPCCPKARIPPRCGGKKIMPPCKKKVAPKPSYSECSKDPLPCARSTECNAWDKRNLENQKKNPSKGRKFSSWAPDEAHVGQNAKTESMDVFNTRPASTATEPSYSEYPDLKTRGLFLTKNDRNHIQQKVISRKQLMLKFMRPAEDADLYYTSESLVKKQKRRPWRKLEPVQLEVNNTERSLGNQLHERKVITLLLQDHHTRNEARVKKLRISHRGSGLGVYEENTFPRDLIGSINNWICGLFKMTGNRSQSIPSPLMQKDQTVGMSYVQTVDVDRIMKLTKPFRHKLKTKHQGVSYYTVDPLGGSQLQNKVPFALRRLWDRQWNKSFVFLQKLNSERARSSMWKFEALAPTVELKQAKEEQTKGEVKLLLPPKEQQIPMNSRLPTKRSEERSLPVVENLSLFVTRNLHENQNSRRVQLSRKNSFRNYTAQVTQKEYTKGAVTFPRKANTSIIKKQKLLGEVEIESKGQAANFLQSATRYHTSGALLRKESPLRKISQPTGNIADINLQKTWLYIDNNTKISLRKAVSSTALVRDNHFYRSEQKTSGKKGEYIVTDDAKFSAGKYLKRKEVMKVLSKLDVRKSSLIISETTAKPRRKKRGNKDILQIIEDTSEVRGKDDGRFSLQRFWKSGKQIGTNTIQMADSSGLVRSLIGLRRSANIENISLSTVNLSKGLHNDELMLQDSDLDKKRLNNGMDHLKTLTKSNGGNKPVRTVSCEKFSLNARGKKELQPSRVSSLKLVPPNRTRFSCSCDSL